MRFWRPAVSPVRGDIVLAAVLVVVGQISIWGGYSHEGPRAVTVPVAFLVAGVLAVRRRAPLALGLVFLTGSVVQVLAARSLNSLWALVILIITAYSIAAYAERDAALISGGLVLAGTYVSQFADPTSALSDKLLAPLVLVGASWIAGRLVRRHGQQARELGILNTELKLRRSYELEQAVAHERTRIARELHDVIAHSISVMVVQAGAGEQLTVDGRAIDVLQSIRRTGKSALSEMRRLLDVLRTEADTESLRPQPGIAELPEIAQRMRESGISVELDLDPSLPELQPGPDLVVYRIVQEALTNTLKHARDAATHVNVRFDGRTIEIEAIDTGGEGRLAPPDGLGHGLVGMRERLALYEGTLASGPTATGGWRVHARLPLDPEALR